MPDDGIDFRAYDSPEDSPIEDHFFDKIAQEVQELITKYDSAFSRFRESVIECDERCKRQVAAQVRWRRRRERFAQWATTQHRLLNKAAGRPGLQYQWEVCCPDICAWFPWKFWLRNCPSVDCPLPLQDGEMERYEKETILAAIYDFSMKGGRRIADGLNLEHYDKLTGINLPEGRYEGLVKQIPAKHLYHLRRWLKQFEKDLRSLATKGASGVQGGSEAPTPADQAEASDAATIGAPATGQPAEDPRGAGVAEGPDAQVEPEQPGTEAATPLASPTLDSLEDPVTCVWVAARIGRAAGRPDALPRRFKSRNYPIVKFANKNYCQRNDAMAMFPKLKHRLIEQANSEA